MEKRKIGDLTDWLNRYISLTILYFCNISCSPIESIQFYFIIGIEMVTISTMGMGGLEDNSEPEVPIVR